MSKEFLSSYSYSDLTRSDDTELDWLELPNIPAKISNPFYEQEHGIYEEQPGEELAKICSNTDYLFFTAKYILNVHLFPFQLAALEILWTKRYPMFVASRGAGKTSLLAIYSLLRMLLEPGCKIAGVGSGLRQARQIFDYMSKIWVNSELLQDIAGKGKNQGPKNGVDKYEFFIGDSIAIFTPLGSGDKIRGMRANYVLIDEFASVPEEIVNVVVRGFAVVKQNVEQSVKFAYRKKRLKSEGLWTKEMEDLETQISQKNQIVYSGTASYSFNHFYKFFVRWRRIIASKGDPKVLDDIFGDDHQLRDAFDWTDYAIIRIPYTHIPEGMMDPSIIADAKANLTPAQFNMEYGAIFSVDSDGFYKRSVLEQATTNKPILLNGKKIQFRCLTHGDKEKRYVIGVDPAAELDNAAIVVLEIEEDHRKIVHCWTTNRKKYQKIKAEYRARGEQIDDDYYGYVASKIRELVSLFQTDRIIMDKHGGGIAIQEALGSRKHNALPIFPIIDPDDPKPTDAEPDGLFILELLAPTNDINAEANHGMLKDFQDRVLLFPKFDLIEMERAIIMDANQGKEIDTYEDLVDEIEELKNEIVSIVQGNTGMLGKETFDLPKVKGPGDKKGYLRKDRYSALLYANYYSRNKGKSDLPMMQYQAVGKLKEDALRFSGQNKGQQMYTGAFSENMKNSEWVKGSIIYKAIRR